MLQHAPLRVDIAELYVIDSTLTALVPEQMTLQITALCTLLSAFTLLGNEAAALDSQAYIEKAAALIKEGEYSLARTYLAPALIDYRLTRGERSRAYYLRGYSYLANNLAVSAAKDYNRALEFNLDNPAALFALGNLHFRGIGLALDEAVAFGLFEKAAQFSHPDAQFRVGFAYLEGRGVEKNLTLARQWLADAAAAENTAAMTYLARSYREGFAEPPQPDLARQWYERAATAGANDALVALAYMHRNGEFVDVDDSEALRLFREAAAAGSGAAQVNLGHLYLTGDIVEQDLSLALDFFNQAAEQGNPASFLSLGHLFESGTGVTQNLQTAKTWFERAARAGLTNAQLRLVYLLRREGDSASALPWLIKAAEQDNPVAQNDYAWFLATNTEDNLRNGQLALTYAQQAVQQNPTPAYLDTLAAAHAELGEFVDAIATQERALALVGDTESNLGVELQSHLNAYRDGKPWRE